MPASSYVQDTDFIEENSLSPTSETSQMSANQFILSDNILTYNSFTVTIHPEDVTDSVFTAIIKALLQEGNRPMSPKELSSIIVKNDFAFLGGSTPFATVSARISQHFKKVATENREALLGKSSDKKSPKRLRYFVQQKGVPVSMSTTTTFREDTHDESDVEPTRRSLRSKTSTKSSSVMKMQGLSSNDESSENVTEGEKGEDNIDRESDQTLINDHIESSRLKQAQEKFEHAHITLNSEVSLNKLEPLNRPMPPPQTPPPLVEDSKEERYIVTDFFSTDYFNEFSLPSHTEMDFHDMGDGTDGLFGTMEGFNKSDFATSWSDNTDNLELLSHDEVEKMLSEDSPKTHSEKKNFMFKPAAWKRTRAKSSDFRGVLLDNSFILDSTARKKPKLTMGFKRIDGDFLGELKDLTGNSKVKADINVNEENSLGLHSITAKSAVTIPVAGKIEKKVYPHHQHVSSHNVSDDVDKMVNYDNDDMNTKRYMVSSVSSPVSKKSTVHSSNINCPISFDLSSVILIPPTPSTSPSDVFKSLWMTMIESIPMFVFLLPHKQNNHSSSNDSKPSLDNNFILLRRADETNAVNASLLLHAGGVTTESERTVILSLERNRVRLSREKSSPLSGPWIPLNRARELALSFCLTEKLGSFLDDSLINQWSSADVVRVMEMGRPSSVMLTTPPTSRRSSPTSEDDSTAESAGKDNERRGSAHSIVIPSDSDANEPRSSPVVTTTDIFKPDEFESSSFQPLNIYRRNRKLLRYHRNRTELVSATISPVKISKDAKEIAAAVAAKDAAKELKEAREKARQAKRKRLELAGLNDDGSESEEIDIDTISCLSEELDDTLINLQSSPKPLEIKKKIKRALSQPEVINKSSSGKKTEKPKKPKDGKVEQQPKPPAPGGVDPEALKKILDDAREKVANRKRLVRSATTTGVVRPVTSTPSTPVVTTAPAPSSKPTPAIPQAQFFPFPFAAFPAAAFPPGFPFAMLPPIPFGMPFALSMFGGGKKQEKTQTRKNDDDEECVIIDVEGDEESANAAK